MQTITWAGFKERDDYPELQNIELPGEDEKILVWEPKRGVWEAYTLIDRDGKLKVVVHEYSGLEETDYFDINDDDFPFIAWLPMPSPYWALIEDPIPFTSGTDDEEDDE